MIKFISSLAVVCVAGALSAADYPIRSVDLTKVRVTDGFWYDRLETNRLATIKADFDKCEETGRLNNFRFAGKREVGKFRGIPFDDSDVYKVIEGAAYAIAVHPDPQLEAYVNKLIEEIATAQEEDGYLYTARTLGHQGKGWHVDMMGKERWSNLSSSHELYNVGHMYEAAVAWYEATGKTNFLDVAKKSADLIYREFITNNRPGVPGHEEIELALVKLYRTTGDARYLELAKHFVDGRGTGKNKTTSNYQFTQEGNLEEAKTHGEAGAYSQNHRPAADQYVAVGHAVRAAYLYCALADIAALTGEEKYVKANKAIWEDVVTTKLHLNGGIGARHAGEAFGLRYELPNDSAYLETCAAIGNALWNDRMFRTTGEAKYMDVVERVIYNGFLSGVSLTGDEFFYPNPLASKGGYKRSKWFGCSCCPVNVVRFIPQIPQMAYATDGKDYFVNLFMTSEADFGDVKLKTDTNYPWDGKVTITVNPKEDGKTFSVKVRVPGWARGMPVPSNLYTQTAPSQMENEAGYRVYTKAWKAGDKIVIDFPMPVKRIAANENVVDDRGRYAVERGPILYCAEGIDNDGKAHDAALPLEATFTDSSVTIGNKTFPALVASNGLKMIPYFAWDHREPGNDMQVWLGKDERVASGNLYGWKISASYCNGSDSVMAPFDGVLPKASSDTRIPRYTAWEHLGQEDWVEVDFLKEKTVNSVSAYWFHDFHGCALPAGWKVQWFDGVLWRDVPADTYPTEMDKFSTVKLTRPVTTQKMRLYFKGRPKLSVGLLEVKID